MFKNNITVAQKPATASETHPALPPSVALKLRSENGATDRGDSHYGNLTIAHSKTKEMGGGYRHVVRLNLREQGDIPPASAYLVIINRDTLPGEDRALQAVQGLLGALIALADDTQSVNINSSGQLLSFYSGGAADDILVDGQLFQAEQVGIAQTVQQLLSRES